MITRRSYLGSLAAVLTGSTLASFGEELKFYLVGICDSMMNSQGTENDKESMSQSISEIFDVPGNSKCQFEIGSSNDLAKRLQAKEMNLAILTGIEYAWIMSKYPTLVPLAVAYHSEVRLKACVLVRDDSSVKTIKGLQGSCITLPERLQQHTYIYLQHAITKEGAEPKGFFGKSITPPDSNEGIEGVLDNKSDAILLDWDAWKGYQERKPARSKKLRIVGESCAFPTSVVLYNNEAQSKLEVPLLKVAIFSAHEKKLARLVLNIWGIKQFVPYGAKYKRAVEETLAAIPQSMSPLELVLKP